MMARQVMTQVFAAPSSELKLRAAGIEALGAKFVDFPLQVEELTGFVLKGKGFRLHLLIQLGKSLEFVLKRPLNGSSYRFQSEQQSSRGMREVVKPPFLRIESSEEIAETAWRNRQRGAALQTKRERTRIKSLGKEREGAFDPLAARDHALSELGELGSKR